MCVSVFGGALELLSFVGYSFHLAKLSLVVAWAGVIICVCDENLTKKFCVYILQADESKSVGVSLDESAPVCCSSTSF